MRSLSTATRVAALTVVLTLAGCGSDDGVDSATTSSPSQGATASPPTGGGFDQGQLEEIRECLDAAGLEDAFPSDMPTDLPTDRPTDMPSEMPSDFDPENPPEGFPSDGPQGQGGFGALQDPEVQDALDACGIELPQRETSAG